jgi:GNAT superfamily N-acetyltransferase
MQIRRAEMADLTALEKLSNQMYSSEATLHDLPTGATARTLEASLKLHSMVQMWLLTAEKQAVGYGITIHAWEHERGAVLWLDELYLTAECRGKGYGQAFFAAMEQYAEQNNFAGLALFVTPQNRGALNLYERLGYELLDYRIMVKDCN